MDIRKFAAVLPPIRPTDHSHSGGGGPSGSLLLCETDNHAADYRECSAAVCEDTLTNHEERGLRCFGNIPRKSIRHSLGLFCVRCFAALIVSVKHGGHAVAVRGDVFHAVVIDANFRPTLFPALAAKCDGLGGALCDFYYKHAVAVADTGGAVFLSNFKLFHNFLPLIIIALCVIIKVAGVRLPAHPWIVG